MSLFVRVRDCGNNNFKVRHLMAKTSFCFSYSTIFSLVNSIYTVRLPHPMKDVFQLRPLGKGGKLFGLFQFLNISPCSFASSFWSHAFILRNKRNDIPMRTVKNEGSACWFSFAIPSLYGSRIFHSHLESLRAL